MRKDRALLLVGLGSVAILTVAQQPPPNLPPRQLPKIQFESQAKTEAGKRTVLHGRPFHIGGKEYVSALAETERSASGWTSSSPLPISLATVEGIARAELRKPVTDESRWQLADIHISRFGAGPTWYFAVTLEPDVQLVGVPPDSFTLLIDFTGTSGQIRRFEPRK